MPGTPTVRKGAPRRDRLPLRVPKKTTLCTLALALALTGRAAADCPRPLGTQLIPLPVYATLPNEGNTWGAMPVILRVCPEDQRTESIFAPSITWNSVIRWNGTFRWYHYPSDATAFSLIASAATRTNYNLWLTWLSAPTAPGSWTDDAVLRVRRNAFERFFGLGPDTPAAAETSYTRLRVIASERRGLVVARHVDVGVTVGFEHDRIERIAVPGLPLAQDAFPAAPGIRGSTVLYQGLDVRYDDRRGGDFATRGVRVDAGGAVVEGLERSPTYLRAAVQARALWPELSWLSGAARVAWNGVTSPRAPFYQQSTLGGSWVLRGFTERRFVDRQAWTAEIEQRIRILQTRIFGVVADWRVDPFVAVGQVFDRLPDAGSRPQVAVGTGFRAWVRPNVLGRIDVAFAGEGAKVYVELGYPY